MGKKTQQNFLCIRCIKDNPKIVVLLLLFSLSLSLLCATQVSECVCSNKNHNSSIYTNCQFTFFTRPVGPNKRSGPTSPRNTQNNILYY